MVRVSECKYWVATVYKYMIFVQKSGALLDTSELRLHEFDKDLRRQAKFTLPAGKYSYLEWPPLTMEYIEKPFFLTLDSKGVLRLHYVNQGEEEVVIPERRVFRSAAFSLDGRHIYAITVQQELCKINLQQESKVVMERRIGGLSNPEEVVSSHIQQIFPWMFVIGSVMRVQNGENQETDLKPYFHLVSGDLSDHQQELKIKAFELPLLEKFDPRKSSIMFRTLYVKERQVLLVGHSGSNKIRVLQFGLDGIEREIDGITLENGPLRGMIFMKEKRMSDLTREYKYEERYLESMIPRLLLLDSKGEMLHFRFIDTTCLAPTLSLFIRNLPIKEFVAGCGRLKLRLSRLRRNRCKSLDNRKAALTAAQKKKRSKSQLPIKDSSEETKKIPVEEKQKISRLLKGSPPNVSLNLSKPAENPFLSAKKTENSLSSAGRDDKVVPKNLFSSKMEEKSTTTSSLFSAVPSSTNTAGNSLFSSPSNLFQKVESRSEPQNSLFSLAPTSTSKPDLFTQKPQSNTSYLFSARSQNKAFQSVPDDPIKKRATLFLNKLGSDVTFKVEDQEFPAHKSVLSERCRFFKNMFESGMSESHAPIIEISDTKAAMFKAFLQYVYFGQSILNEELAMNLFEFSEKYIMDELKGICENFLKGALTVNNCLKIYEVACFYEAESLKKKTLLFFEAHLKEITQRRDFEALPKSTYILLKRMQWNDKMTFDHSFARYMKSLQWSRNM